MKKFPVTSEYGNEYEVQFYRDTTAFGGLQVEVYEHYIGRFRKPRMKQVNRELSKHSYYDEVAWNYDYVGMAKQEVRKYENSIAEKLLRKRLEAEGLEAFAEWDGK